MAGYAPNPNLVYVVHMKVGTKYLVNGVPKTLTKKINPTEGESHHPKYEPDYHLYFDNEETFIIENFLNEFLKISD